MWKALMPALAVLLLGTLPASAQTAFERADQWFEQRQDSFEGRLEARFNVLQEVRWPQVLLTHTLANMPHDGTPKTPDALTRLASDNGDGWAHLSLTIGGAWYAALSVDNYGGPSGKGYVINLWIVEAGVLYNRGLNFGPETWRTTGWAAVAEVP